MQKMRTNIQKNKKSAPWPLYMYTTVHACTVGLYGHSGITNPPPILRHLCLLGQNQTINISQKGPLDTY